MRGKRVTEKERESEEEWGTERWTERQMNTDCYGLCLDVLPKAQKDTGFIQR